MTLVKFSRVRVWALFVLLAARPTALAAESAPPFDLPRHGAEGRVRLEDFAGQIVVLDFFAYWCAPCAKASLELETDVQQFYAARHGNARGVPVRVMSVNIEKDQPARTDRFLRQTGASLVADDPAAALLKQFGAVNIPFLVVIDGTAAQPGAPQFRVAYQHAGFEGVEKLRRILDGLGTEATAKTPDRESKAAAVPNRAAGTPRTHTVEAESDFAWASDVLLTDSTIRYGQKAGGTEWDASMSYATFDLDYRPFLDEDAFGFTKHLREDRVGGQSNLRQRVADPVTVLASAGGYVGCLDYRRVWIANRFRQKYDHPKYSRIPPYEEPDPKGFNGSLGARWEYRPALGFAEARLGYARDQIAPGYEDSVDARGDYQLLKGRERLDTRTFAFSSENVLAPRLRLLNEFTFADTTARELRFTYQGSFNVAVGERWVARAYGGLSTEKPKFDAHFFGATVEYELLPNLLLSLTGRYYTDTGEIENLLSSVTSAAPPLTSWEAGAGLRWTVGRSSFKVYVALFRTDYRFRRGIGDEFTYLYTDRKWGLAQAAWSLQF